MLCEASVSISNDHKFVLRSIEKMQKWNNWLPSIPFSSVNRVIPAFSASGIRFLAVSDNGILCKYPASGILNSVVSVCRGICLGRLVSEG